MRASGDEWLAADVGAAPVGSGAVRRPGAAVGQCASAPDMTFDGAVLARVPRQARSRDKVSRALAAAERLLARDGSGALTLTAVAREAGVSVGALHQYLPDREAIVRALLTRYHASFERLMTELLAGPALATDDPVGLVVDAFADLHRRSAGVRALGLEAAQRDVHAREHKARMAGMLEQLLRARGLLLTATGQRRRGEAGLRRGAHVVRRGRRTPPRGFPRRP